MKGSFVKKLLKKSNRNTLLLVLVLVALAVLAGLYFSGIIEGFRVGVITTTTAKDCYES